jgi:hypothetical protein
MQLKQRTPLKRIPWTSVFLYMKNTHQLETPWQEHPGHLDTGHARTTAHSTEQTIRLKMKTTHTRSGTFATALAANSVRVSHPIVNEFRFFPTEKQKETSIHVKSTQRHELRNAPTTTTTITHTMSA